MFEINVHSTPDERYNGVIRAQVDPILDELNLTPAYTEGGAGAGEADNFYGLDCDQFTAERLAKTIRERTGRVVDCYQPATD